MSSTALTPRPGVFSLAPQSFQEALHFANLMASSDMVPKDYVDRPGRVLAAIQYGAEVGLPPMQSLQRIFIVHGKPTMDTRGILSIVVASGHLERKDEQWDPVAKIATIRLKRRGNDEIVRTFSEEDAKLVVCKEDGQNIRLSDKALYKSYPQRMYTRRALGYALQDEFSDIIGGLTPWDITQFAADGGDGPRGNVIDGQVIESKPAPAPTTNGTIDPEMALKLDQAFAAIHLAPQQQRLKLMSFRGREAELLEWCRKEYLAKNGLKIKAKPDEAAAAVTSAATAASVEQDIRGQMQEVLADATTAILSQAAATASTPAELPDPEPERPAPELATMPNGDIVRADTAEVILQPASKLKLVGKAKKPAAEPALVGDDK